MYDDYDDACDLDFEDDCDYEDDCQPDEYTEWQDYMGGDDDPREYDYNGDGDW